MKKFLFHSSQYLFILILILLKSESYAQWSSLEGPTIQAGGYSSAIGIIDNRAFIQDDAEPTWEIVYGLYEITNNGKKLSRVENVGTFTTNGSFAADDQTIFMGITGGIVISNDKGNNWETYNYSIFGSESVAALIVKGDTMLASSAGHLFRSFNHGITWNQISWKSMKYVNGNGIILVGQDLFMLAYHDLLKSSDWGESWVSVGSSWPNTLDLLYDGSRLFVACDAGLYTSDDQGQTFTFHDLGFYWINTLTQKDGYLLAGTSLDDRIYRSDDHGMSWTGLPNTLIDNFVLELASTDAIVIAGLSNGYVYSQDNGNNWDIIHSTPVTARKIFKKESLIYAGTPNGLFCYSPTDSSWKILNKNLELNSTNDFTIENTIIYTANDGGIYKSDNQGQSWNLLGLSNYTPKTLTIHNSDILVGTNRDGVFYTGTDGQLWISRNSGLPTKDEFGNYNPVISSLINNSVALIGFAGDGIFRSENKGVTWEKCSGISNDTIRTIIQAGSEYFAASNQGVYTSSDEGRNWNKLPDPLLVSDVSDLFYNGVNLFVSLRHGGLNIWDKDNNSWIILNAGIPSYDLISLTGDSSNLVISTSSKGVYTRKIKNDLGNELFPDVSPNIYPNPCQSTICIETKTIFTKDPVVVTHTIHGKKTLTRMLSSINGSILLDVSHLPPGIYMVRISTSTNDETYKFVKTI